MIPHALPRSVLIIEDASTTSDLIAERLQQQMFSVAVVRDVEAAKLAVAVSKPSLLVMDCMAPVSEGIPFLQAFRADPETAQVPVIMLAAHTGEEVATAALEAGADDYVAKPFSPGELVARVKAVLRRRAPELTDDTIRLRPLTLSPTRFEVKVIVGGRETRIQMGPTEFRLLHFFMTHPEQVHSRAQIRRKLWSDHSAIDERTIDAHIKRLRACLASVGLQTMVQTIRYVGYRLSNKAAALGEPEVNVKPSRQSSQAAAPLH